MVGNWLLSPLGLVQAIGCRNLSVGRYRKELAWFKVLSGVGVVFLS